MIYGVEENDVWLNWAYLSRQYPISNIKATEVVYGPTEPRRVQELRGCHQHGHLSPGERGDFSRGEQKFHLYTNINVGAAPFNTKDLDITIGNTMAKSKIKYQLTAFSNRRARFYRGYLLRL